MTDHEIINNRLLKSFHDELVTRGYGVQGVEDYAQAIIIAAEAILSAVAIELAGVHKSS